VSIADEKEKRENDLVIFAVLIVSASLLNSIVLPLNEHAPHPFLGNPHAFGDDA
jgi:hypothetical protein